MKKTRMINCLILLVLAVFSLSISGCSHKDKEIVVTKNVRAEAKQEKNQVKKYIKLGNKLLEQSKYDDAKSAYEKAIKFDKINKQTYLTIEDKYMEKNRIQDAAGIIQEAVNNNVDAADMKKILLELQQKEELANKEVERNKETAEVSHKQNGTVKSVENQEQNQGQNQGQNQEQNQNNNSKFNFKICKADLPDKLNIELKENQNIVDGNPVDIRGWKLSISRIDSVDLYVDGNYERTFCVRQGYDFEARPDVLKLFPEYKDNEYGDVCGFHWPRYLPVGSHNIRVYAMDSYKNILIGKEVNVNVVNK